MVVDQMAQVPDPEYPKIQDGSDNLCCLCQGNLSLKVQIPEEFHSMASNLSVDQSIEFATSTIACACGWFSSWNVQPSRTKYAKAYHDVSACLLGTATRQQWFNAVGNSGEPGDESVYRFAYELQLSMDDIV